MEHSLKQLSWVYYPTTELPETLLPPEGYPNPFQRHATLRYVLSEARHVVLAVYDVLGRHIATLVDGVQATGPPKSGLRRDIYQAACIFTESRRQGRHGWDACCS